MYVDPVGWSLPSFLGQNLSGRFPALQYEREFLRAIIYEAFPAPRPGEGLRRGLARAVEYNALYKRGSERTEQASFPRVA